MVEKKKHNKQIQKKWHLEREKSVESFAKTSLEKWI